MSAVLLVAIIRGIGWGLVAAGLMAAGMNFAPAFMIGLGLAILTGARRPYEARP